MVNALPFDTNHIVVFLVPELGDEHGDACSEEGGGPKSSKDLEPRRGAVPIACVVFQGPQGDRGLSGGTFGECSSRVAEVGQQR